MSKNYQSDYDNGYAAGLEAGHAAAIEGAVECWVVWWKGSKDRPDLKPGLCSHNGHTHVYDTDPDASDAVGQTFDCDRDEYEVRPARLVLP